MSSVAGEYFGDGSRNPFTSGYLRLVSDGGTGTLLQYSAGATGTNWTDVLLLQNTSPPAFNYDNFSPQYGPDGTGATIVDTDDAHSLGGTPSNDTITGNGGNDYLYAGYGNDQVYAGAGNDQVNGEGGNDTLYGGLDNDYLYGGAGNDTALGDEGDDYFSDYEGTNTLYGGQGNDTFVNVGYGSGIDTYTGGAGRDGYTLNWQVGNAVDVVADFAAGLGGDVINVLSVASEYFGDGSRNPFTSGYLRLLQSGADTVLQFSAGATGTNWTDVLRLQGVTASSLNYDNFSPQYGPDGTGATIVDTDDGHSLGGTPSNDTITGNGGGDYIYAGYGADTVYAGAGNDQVNGEGGNDTLYGGVDNDYIYGGAGNDASYGDDGDDYFSDYEGTNASYGGAGNDTFVNVGYGSGVDTLTGGAGRDGY